MTRLAPVEQWSAKGLPYVDNCVNLVVSDSAGNVSKDELLRVLVPNGVALTAGARDQRSGGGIDDAAIEATRLERGPAYSQIINHRSSIIDHQSFRLAHLSTRRRTQRRHEDCRRGALLVAVSPADGGKLAAYRLDTLPCFDGLIAAAGRLYLSTVDGKVLCLGPDRGAPLRSAPEAVVTARPAEPIQPTLMGR